MSLSNKHYLGHRDRLKQRFMAAEKGQLPDYEIIELLLFMAIPRRDVKPLAKELLNQFGNVNNLIYASPEELIKIEGVSKQVLTNFKLIQELAERLLQENTKEKTVLQNWQSLIDYCKLNMGTKKTESLNVIFLNSANQVIENKELAKGTLNRVSIYPREIVKTALSLNAASIILVHNHPGKDVKPSDADIEITKLLKNALAMMEISLQDHIIVSNENWFSFKGAGMV